VALVHPFGGVVMFRWLLRVTLMALIAAMILPLASITPVAAAIRANPAPTELHVIPAGEKVVRAKYAHAMQSTNLNCDIVELYPGYPGYRGNINGVMPHYGGLGDYECLHILEQDFPQFDRAREDRANQQAADALGITGPMNLWTWENWMLIEAERGMTPSCYTCLMFDTKSSPTRLNVYPDQDDYRILTGFPGYITAIQTIAANAGIDNQMGIDGTLQYYGYDDYTLRSVAYSYGQPTMNAQELYVAMFDWVQVPFQPSGSDGLSVDPREMEATAIYQNGGYALTPVNAAPADQVFLMFYSLSTYITHAPPATAEVVFSQFDLTVMEWRSSMGSGMTLSLAEFMQQYWN
jgi:hypothetical protein